MALFRVFAHHRRVPAAFGVPSTVASGALPAPIAVYWCELTDLNTVVAEGYGPPVVPGPVTSAGAPLGNFPKPADDGFTGGVDVALTRICVVSVASAFNKDFEYTLISPAGQVIVVPTTGAAIPAPVGTGQAMCVPVTIPQSRGVWTVEVRLKPGATSSTRDFEWNASVGYVGLSGSPAEALLAVIFEGTLVTTTTTTTTPPPACHNISVTNTPIPCSQGGTAAVQALFTASLTPAMPPFAGTIDWEVTDLAGNVVASVPGGGTVVTLAFPGAGDYQVTASIVRPGCSPLVKVWSRQVTVLSCNCPTFSGVLHAAPSPADGCTWNFWVAVNNPGAVPISYEWDFDVGGTPARTAVTSVPNASVTYGGSGPRTVRVTLRAGGCSDQLQTTIVVDCSPGTTAPPTTSGTTAPPTTSGTTAPPTTGTTSPPGTGTTPPPTSATTAPPAPTGIGCLCALVLVPAMIAVALAGVAFAAWGCTAGLSPSLLLTGIAATGLGLVLFGIWMATCRDCPRITFLSNFFAAMVLLMVVVAALLSLAGQFGCGRGAAIVAVLFLVVALVLGAGRRALRCP